VIVVDTSVLVYAVGTEHPLRESCREIVAALGDGLDATTTVEVIQEFAHVHGRRRPRPVATTLARRFAQGLAPLLVVDVLRRGLDLFEQHESLGAFDVVLAAAAITISAEALVSANRTFEAVDGLRVVLPGSAEAEALMS